MIESAFRLDRRVGNLREVSDCFNLELTTTMLCGKNETEFDKNKFAASVNRNCKVSRIEL